MPLYTHRTESYDYTWAQRNFTSQPWSAESKSNYKLVSLSVDKPATVKRTFPTDEFLSGTARTVSSAKRFTTTMNTMTPGYRQDGIPFLAAFYTSNVPVPSNALTYDALYNRIRAELRQDATNLAQACAEYRQTAKLFADLVGVVLSRGKTLVRRHPSIASWNPGKPSLTRSAANAHLAWQYGIKPLMDDINGSVSDLRKALDTLNRPLYIQGRVGQAARAVTSPKTSRTVVNSVFYAQWSVESKLVLTSRWRAYLNKDIVLSGLAAHGFTNPLAVTYNLVPYSFVLDWWVNLGDVLASLDNLIICDSLWVANGSSRRTLKRGYTLHSGQGTNTYQSFATGEEYTRVDSRTAPLQISRVSTLAYKPSVSMTHISNGVSLLRNAMKKF